VNILHEVAGELRKMFVGDGWLAGGTLSVVLVVGGLTISGAVPAPVGGALLFLGCIAVLVGSIVLSVRGKRVRRPGPG
jgi:hypothetical protein